MKSILTLSYAFIFSIGLLSTVLARGYNANKNKVVIRGYDPVAYFTLKKAKKGNSQFSYAYKGGTFWFASKKHLNLFKADPKKYEPQYGGWCAYAMGKYDKKAQINPKTFKITNGKLYLFYNKLVGGNTLKFWNKEGEANLIKKADANWKQ